MTRPPCLPSADRPGISRGLAALLFGAAYGFVVGVTLASIIWGVFLCACAS